MSVKEYPGPHRVQTTDPALEELYKLLLKSEKFLNWKPESARASGPEWNSELGCWIETSCIMKDKHYTPAELAELWGVSVQTIREIFKSEEGVLKIGSDGTRTRRAYKTLRIPESVAERVHTRLSA